ncbi:hypothetical protein J6590_067102 [Homalodisca vitripennis]|nr:hypothetical protein J6590_067102 [Homalodisca vitripennis]
MGPLHLSIVTRSKCKQESHSRNSSPVSSFGGLVHVDELSLLVEESPDVTTEGKLARESNLGESVEDYLQASERVAMADG